MVVDTYKRTNIKMCGGQKAQRPELLCDVQLLCNQIAHMQHLVAPLGLHCNRGSTSTCKQLLSFRVGNLCPFVQRYNPPFWWACEFQSTFLHPSTCYPNVRSHVISSPHAPPSSPISGCTSEWRWSHGYKSQWDPECRTCCQEYTAGVAGCTLSFWVTKFGEPEYEHVLRLSLEGKSCHALTQ